MGDNFKYIDRKDACERAPSLLRRIYEKSCAIWEAELKAVIPPRASVLGFVCKMIFTGVPEDLMENHLIPGMEEHNCIVIKIQKMTQNWTEQKLRSEDGACASGSMTSATRQAGRTQSTK